MSVKIDQIVILIPIYKAKLSSQEELSLHQCFHMLGHYKIIFFAPESLPPCGYTADHEISRFSDHYFTGRTGYNRLTLSKEFYHRFRKYQYMLLYQLDAYVFKDELLEWCQKGYSYIGAPWLTGFNTDPRKYNFWKTGNGGFSLRKISDFMEVLSQPHRRVRKYTTFKRKYRHLPPVKRHLVAAREFLAHPNSLHSFISTFSSNEDNFWSIYAKIFNRNFTIPSPEEAAHFALECGAQRAYEKNKTLPFGCHAWERYEPEFWSAYITAHSNGNKISKPIGE